MSRTLNRWLAVALTGIILTAALLVGRRDNPVAPEQAGAGAKAGGQSWAMFGGSLTRNMVNTAAKGLPTEWNTDEGEQKNVKWVADLGSKAYGGPLIVDGRVFVGTNNQKPRDPKYVKDGKPIDMGVLMCFNEADGKFLWQTVSPKLSSGLVNDWPYEGICSTPHIVDGKLYYVSNRCEVICADARDGKPVWKLDMIKELGVFPHNIAAGSPLVTDGNLFVVTANGVNEDHINVPAPRAPSFIKVSQANGKVLWQDNRPTIRLTEVPKGAELKSFSKNLINRGELIQHGQWSNPAYAVVAGQPQVIFPGGDGWIYAFDPADGKLIWRFDCNPKDAEYELSGKGTRNDFIATPVIYKDRVYIGVGQDPDHSTGVGHLWCIDMTKKGDVSPDRVVDDKVWPPKTEKNPNSALVWHYGGAITDPAERKKLGRNSYFGRTMSTCAIHDGLCYAAELLGILHCLDAETGKVHWEHNAEARIWSSPYYADGKVYLGADDGTMFVFAHGKTKKKLAENVAEGRVCATPAAANGTLFVMTENKLYAIAEGAGKK